MYTQQQRETLLSIARQSVNDAFVTGEANTVDESLLESSLCESRGCFVSLHDVRLRGCIGFMLPYYPLYEAVQRCAVSAAFDSAYVPLTSQEEIEAVSIEISVLSPLEPFSYATVEDLTAYLRENKPGVHISLGSYSAVYLPTVWEDIPEVEDFLTQLCFKAGLSGDTWKEEMLEVKVFTAEVWGDR